MSAKRVLKCLSIEEKYKFITKVEGGFKKQLINMVDQPLQSERFLKIKNQLQIHLNLDFKRLLC